MRKIVLSLFCMVLGAYAAQPEFKVSEVDGMRKVEVFGDWHIDETVDADKTLYEVHGNILLETNGVWNLSNSELRIMCTFSREFEMRWDGGAFFTTNCTVGGRVLDSGRLAAANFALKDGSWEGVDTTVQNTYGISFYWNGDFTGKLRGTRFNAGPNPDSIIISGGADIVLEDSTYPIALGLHTEKGGKATLDLPCGEALTCVFDKETLLGAETFRVELKNVTVPRWFVFVRNIWPDNPPSEIVIDRCESLLINCLGHNVKGDITLSPDLSSPVRIGSVTLKRGTGPVNLSMYGGLYFSGEENDAIVTGPATIAEVMLWGGKVRVVGSPSRDVLLLCTTLDVHETGELELENVVLGSANGNGQIIVSDQGRITARNVDMNRLLLKTKDEGTMTFEDADKKGDVREQAEGGAIVFKEPITVIEKSGDWHLAASESYSNAHIMVDGNFYLDPGAELVLDHCILEIKGEYSRQHQVYWNGGRLVTKSSTVGGSVHEGVFANTIFNLEDGEWIAEDTTVQYSYGITFSQETVGRLRALRLHQGPMPDSLIISGKADVVMTDSEFVIALNLYTQKGGTYTLDLPIDQPISHLYDSTTLPIDYRLELNNHVVPGWWFVFFRRIQSDHPECEIVLRDCPKFLPHLLGHNIQGDIRLASDLKEPLRIGNLTVRKADYPVDAFMLGTYFSGDKTDAVIHGPTIIGEHMQWGGRVVMSNMVVTCTTLDLYNGARLELRDVRLGRPLDWDDDGSTGELHMRDNSLASGSNVELGRMVLHTSDKGRIDFSKVTANGGPQKLREDGGPINLGGFQPSEN